VDVSEPRIGTFYSDVAKEVTSTVEIMSTIFDPNLSSTEPVTRRRWHFLALHRCASCETFERFNQSDSFVSASKCVPHHIVALDNHKQ
jgi:hypothetical protein